jgi:toxin ParE1/3/4
MRVRYSKQAQADLIEIAQYISVDNPSAAALVSSTIQRAIDLLSRRPGIGMTNRRAPGLRSKLAVPYPYRIHYRIRNETLWIVHVRHTSRREWRGK